MGKNTELIQCETRNIHEHILNEARQKSGVWGCDVPRLELQLKRQRPAAHAIC